MELRTFSVLSVPADVSCDGITSGTTQDLIAGDRFLERFGPGHRVVPHCRSPPGHRRQAANTEPAALLTARLHVVEQPWRLFDSAGFSTTWSEAHSRGKCGSIERRDHSKYRPVIAGLHVWPQFEEDRAVRVSLRSTQLGAHLAHNGLATLAIASGLIMFRTCCNRQRSRSEQPLKRIRLGPDF